jgi:hypothetical protein
VIVVEFLDGLGGEVVEVVVGPLGVELMWVILVKGRS